MDARGKEKARFHGSLTSGLLLSPFLPFAILASLIWLVVMFKAVPEISARGIGRCLGLAFICEEILHEDAAVRGGN